MEDYNPAKGKQKSFNYWLEDELEDFCNIPESNPKTKKFLAQLSHHFTYKYPKSDSQTKKILVNLKKINPPSKASSLMFWNSINENLCFKIASFLTDKAFIYLLLTCKIVNSKFDTSRIWEMLYDRNMLFAEEDLKSGFKRSLDVEKYSLKQLYKYMNLLSGNGIFYYSNSLVKHTEFETNQLVRYMVDFVSTPTLTLMLNNYSSFKNITKDLKLTLLEENNEVILWVSGFEDFEVPAQPNGPAARKVKRTKAFVLRQFKLPDDEKIINAFFLEKKYLVIEYEQEALAKDYLNDKTVIENYKIELGLEEEEEKDDNEEYLINGKGRRTAKGFLLFNLKELIRSLFIGNQRIDPTKYRFFEIKEDILKFPCSPEITNFSLNFKKDAMTRPYKIEMKCLKEDRVVFFLKNISSTLAFVCDMNTGNLVCKINLPLDAPLLDIITPKALSKHDEVTFYALDNNSTFYSIAFSIPDRNLSIKKLLIGEPQEETKESSQTRFKNAPQRYYHGTYDSKENEDQSPKEFLVIYKALALYFIDPSQIQSKKFDFGKNTDTIEASFLNWSIYQDLLWMYTSQMKYSYQICFSDLSLKLLQEKPFATKEDSEAIWIFNNPCFTVSAIGYSAKKNDNSTLSVRISSTQKLVLSATEEFTLTFQNLDILDFFVNHRLQRKQKEGKEEIKFKFEDEKLLIRSKKYNFFLDLAMAMKQEKEPWERWSQRASSIRMSDLKRLKPIPQEPPKVEIKVQKKETSDEEDKEGEEGEEDEEFFKRSKNPMKTGNPNKKGGQKWQKKGPQASKIKNETQIDQKEMKNIMKRKGPKYHKNVREDGRHNKVVESD